MSNLTDLPNIGPKLAEELNNVGIKTYEDLCSTGSAQILFKLKGNAGHCCMNTLYALEGAIQKIRWHSLPDADRKRVRAEYLSFIE